MLKPRCFMVPPTTKMITHLKSTTANVSFVRNVDSAFQRPPYRMTAVIDRNASQKQDQAQYQSSRCLLSIVRLKAYSATCRSLAKHSPEHPHHIAAESFSDASSE